MVLRAHFLPWELNFCHLVSVTLKHMQVLVCSSHSAPALIVPHMDAAAGLAASAWCTMYLCRSRRLWGLE